MKSRSFIPLFVTNFFGVVNDNFLKTLASFIVIGWLADASGQSVFMGVAAGALVLPFILFSPLADRLTALFPKVRILRFAKMAEVPIVLLAVAGFLAESPALVVGAIVLMGLQSSLYSPAKYALVRDIGGADRISTGMGGMEGVTFAAVLAGTVAGSFVADLEGTAPWIKNAGLVTLAALGLIASFTVRAEEERNRELHAINPVRYLTRAWRMTRRYEGLNAVILTLSVFWWAAAMLQMGLLVYGKQVLGLDATHTGLTLALAAVGIVAGQVVAGFIDRRHFLLGWTPLTGVLAGIVLLVLFFVPMNAAAFSALVAVLAFDFGLFKLPFDTEIQKVVKGPRLNTMLAYFNQVSFLFMLAASGVYALVSWAFGPRAFLLVLALAMFIAPFWFLFHYRSVLCYVGRWVLTRRYAVTTSATQPLRHSATEPPISNRLSRPSEPSGDGRSDARRLDALAASAPSALRRALPRPRRHFGDGAQDAWRGARTGPAQASQCGRREGRTWTHRCRDGRARIRQEHHLLSLGTHLDRAARGDRHATARVQRVPRPAAERACHRRADDGIVGQHLESAEADLIAVVRTDAYEVRPALARLPPPRPPP